MPIPATTGILRSRIQDLSIGDYIYGFYDKSISTWGIGEAKGVEYPLEGMPATSFDTGYFYYIKVDIGLLVADRIIQNTQSWNTLNQSSKVIQGRTEVFGGVKGSFRSLTGGVAYSDVNGNLSLSDMGLGGWPSNNEWDKYIVNFPTEKIQFGKTLDDVFNWSPLFTWTQDTPTIGLVIGSTTVTNAFRTFRGRTTVNHFSGNLSNNSASVGFRPVFEYKEV
ncbi:hypothetical protein JCM10914A_40560 [Paenibacillus sp. JCM 10914]|uniref:hypothetical protein n=1 Tax=Paenibacillus sp. JCM 10914 TaxID=1236974 RepID=UPI0003CC45DB|nr:hypothetical protein [Paenibacillus sp. JCM 10914]GAE05268.1 hypothetical protein JCM10914_1363 [Paenibacillus sp. JCM 10914]